MKLTTGIREDIFGPPCFRRLSRTKNERGHSPHAIWWKHMVRMVQISPQVVRLVWILRSRGSEQGSGLGLQLGLGYGLELGLELSLGYFSGIG